MKVTRHQVSAAVIAIAAGLTLSAVTPVLAAGTPAPSWPQPRYDAAGTGYNPTETQLGTGNAGKLVTRAIAPLGRPFSAAAPVVADGLVIVTGYYSTGGQPGEIEAFPESCGAPLGLSCKPVWKAFVSYDDSMGVTVADGMVFANTLTYKPSQKLWVFSDHCATGGGTCSPLWTTTIPGLSYADQAPTVAGGVIYVPYGQVGHASLYAYPEFCKTGCQPLWRGQLQSGADDSAAVADGFVFVPDYDGYIYAFRAGCATGGKVCAPAWLGNVGENGPRGAAVANGLLFIGSQNGDVFAFQARGCGQLFCLPVWTAVSKPGANFLARPAVADGLVFISNYVTGYLYAYPEHCAQVCKPAWQAFLAPKNLGAPAVANGVVYVAEGDSAKNVGIDAFSVHCATGGGTCTPLWHGNGGSYYVPSDPVVAGGELWTTGGPPNGPANLYAFGLPVPGAARVTAAPRGGGRPAPRPLPGH
jgi:outer membrane protein assembly factor BamB